MAKALKLNADGTLGWEKQNKFRNQPKTMCLNCCSEHIQPCCDDFKPYRFASSLEASRYAKLKMLERAGLITDLAIQVRYPLEVKGHLITTYIADFVYIDDAGEGLAVVEDTKSPASRTNEYLIKKKLMKALYSIDIQEVYAK